MTDRQHEPVGMGAVGTAISNADRGYWEEVALQQDARLMGKRLF